MSNTCRAYFHHFLTMPLGILVVLAILTNYEIHHTCIYLYLALLVTYNNLCMMHYMRLCNVEYSQGFQSYYFKCVHIFIGTSWYIELQKFQQRHILKAQSRPRFQLTAKK